MGGGWDLTAHLNLSLAQQIVSNVGNGNAGPMARDWGNFLFESFKLCAAPLTDTLCTFVLIFEDF